MTSHKFRVGETVAFRIETRLRVAARGEYGVIAHRPVSNGEPWYIIKSALEQHDRVVAESDLTGLLGVGIDAGISE